MTTVMSPMPEQQTKAASAALERRVDRNGGQTMKAIYLERKAGTEALVAEEIPRPKPQAGEVSVKVHATSVMPTELQWFTTFNLPFGEPRPFPIVLSHEFSGVIASVSSGGLDFARFLGADAVVDYRTTRFEEVVKDVDVVFDCVGGETLERSWGVLAKGGRMVTVATQSAGIAGQRARDAFMRVRADGLQLAEIANLIDAGELQVFVGTIFPLIAARIAYTRARSGLRRGKVALRVAE